jgi:ribosomal protein L22
MSPSVLLASKSKFYRIEDRFEQKGIVSMKKVFGFMKATLVAAVLGGSVYLSPSVASADDLLTIGSSAPALDVEHWVQNGEGKFGKVTKFEKDKVYIVEFWATWCGPCVAGIPHLNALHLTFKDKGLVVIGQNVEGKDQTPVKAFVEKMADGMTYPVALDNTSGSEQESMRHSWLNAAGLNHIPAAFLVGKVLRSAVANAENNHELDAEDLIVASAVATPGPSLKRIMPRARGSASPIIKRMTHITVVLGNKPEEAAKPAKRINKSKAKASAE